MVLTPICKLVSIANYNSDSMSTKKRSRNRRSSRSLTNGSPEETNEPQGLKPASPLSSDGTAESRDVSQPAPAGLQASRFGLRHPSAEVLTVADRLHSAAIHLLRRVRKQDVATGEGPARLSALSVLVFGGPKTLGELAAAEQVKPPTMSRIVAGLERSRLVVITKDPEDARRMRITATPKGTRLLQKGRERRINYLASQLNDLAPGELSRLRDALEILGRMLQTWR